MTWRILNAEPDNYSDQAVAILRQIGAVDLQQTTRAQLLREIAGYEVLIVRLAFQVDREIMDAAPRLRAIVSATTGVDHLDLAYATEKNIAVLTLRGEYEFLRTIPATVEHTIALLLSVRRQIPAAAASVRQGEWNRDAFRGHDLYQQSLGIIGLGRIGERIAVIAQSFGMQVAAFDPYRTADWPVGVARCATLPELLARSQIVTLHVPLNAETHHLVGANELACLPPGAVLINTSRGEVIDENVLVNALETGHLSAAAVDVIQNERNPEHRQQSPLIQYARAHDNLIITPHIGGATYESMAMTEIFMAQKLRAFFEQTTSA